METIYAQKHLKERISAFLRMRGTEALDKLGRGPSFSATSKFSKVNIMEIFVILGVLLYILTDRGKNEEKPVQKISNGVCYYTNPCLQKKLFVRFKKLDSLDPYEHGLIKGLNLNGFTVNATLVDEPLTVNQIIEISIRELQDASESIEAIGHVAWVKENGDNSYEIGVMFTHISEENSGRLIKYFCEEA